MHGSVAELQFPKSDVTSRGYFKHDIEGPLMYPAKTCNATSLHAQRMRASGH